MSTPNHIGIIMDGNGRWAQAHGHNRLFGHVRGARVAKSIIEGCADRGVKYLTLFAFSTENWLRPTEEVNLLMRLLFLRLNRERNNLIRNNIKFRCVGNIARLPNSVRETVLRTIRETDHCTGMTLTFALSYGGRQEITEAAKGLARLTKEGKLDPEKITTEMFSSHLESSFLPDPDLIIRTSGESRLSNFFLWSAAYSELLIVEKMWPDFNLRDLDSAILEFGGRERRFGKTSAQVWPQVSESSETTGEI